ncbi:hypothetical protein [Amycolatopsis sp. NPDC059657]|uniref:hypothetical protein n=1 Tax=Amycolatopsis sp. NPDC059657 TaxID=3346899 RepID=UPI003670DA5F
MQSLPQLPPHLMAIQDIDADLELAPSDEPGFSRRSDLIVVGREAVTTADDEDSMLKAGDVVIIVEIVSPGSKRHSR